MKNLKPFFLLIILISIGCESLKPVNRTLYQESIKNTMFLDSSKIATNLVAITRENDGLIWKKIGEKDYILVATWINEADIKYYKPSLDSGNFSRDIWVTTAPELVRRMKQENVKNVDLRLKQLLGLPPNATYSHFVELWVNPDVLFRPCLDKEITDGQCDLCFPKNTDSTYVSWIYESRVERFTNRKLYDNYPWTQLGYTYDWSNKNNSHIGLSEFVIGDSDSTDILVEGIYTTKDYLDIDVGK